MTQAQIAYRIECRDNCYKGYCPYNCSEDSYTTFLTGHDVTWVQLLTDIEKITKMFTVDGPMNATSMLPVDSIVTLWDIMRDNVLDNIVDRLVLFLDNQKTIPF